MVSPYTRYLNNGFIESFSNRKRVNLPTYLMAPMFYGFHFISLTTLKSLSLFLLLHHLNSYPGKKKKRRRIRSLTLLTALLDSNYIIALKFSLHSDILMTFIKHQSDNATPPHFKYCNSSIKNK